MELLWLRIVRKPAPTDLGIYSRSILLNQVEHSHPLLHGFYMILCPLRHILEAFHGWQDRAGTCHAADVIGRGGVRKPS